MDGRDSGPAVLVSSGARSSTSELEESDKAMDCLENAHAQREPFVAYLATDPRWDPLRETPRFQALVRRVAGPRP